MPPFGKRDSKKDRREPSMVYDGRNGAEITDWSRDGDLSVRFQDRSRLIGGEVARIRLPLDGEAGGDHWVVVPVGATIHQTLDDERHLSLELPEDEPAEAGEDKE